MAVLVILPSGDANRILFLCSSHVSHAVSSNPKRNMYPTGFRSIYAWWNCVATKTEHLQQIPVEGHPEPWSRMSIPPCDRSHVETLYTARFSLAT